MTDVTESIRRERLTEINSEPNERETLAAKHGQVWNTGQLTADFEVLGFMAPYVVVKRKADGRKGSLEFQHSPRLYYRFVTDAA